MENRNAFRLEFPEAFTIATSFFTGCLLSQDPKSFLLRVNILGSTVIAAHLSGLLLTLHHRVAVASLNRLARRYVPSHLFFAQTHWKKLWDENWAIFLPVLAPALISRIIGASTSDLTLQTACSLLVVAPTMMTRVSQRIHPIAALLRLLILWAIGISLGWSLGGNLNLVIAVFPMVAASLMLLSWGIVQKCLRWWRSR